MRGYGFFGAAALLALAGFGGRLLYDRAHAGDPSDGSAPEPRGDAVERRQRPAFTLGDLDGERRAVAEWDGQVLLLNFWATWCPPCRVEIPELITLQQEYGRRGLQVVGIAIDDPQATADFVQETGLNYPILTGQQDALQVAVAYGNAIGALPYTVVVDRGGGIAYTREGELDRRAAEAVIVSLLEPE